MHARHHSCHPRDVPMGRDSSDLGDGAEHPWLRKLIDPDTGCWELSILGRLVLRLDPASRRCAWLWRHADSGEPREMRLQPDLLEPVLDPTVMALFGERLLQRAGAHERLNMPTMAACRQAMQARLSEDPQWRTWQQDWRQALYVCQPQVLTGAERTLLGPGDGLCPARYTLIWRHLERFVDVGRNAPRLSPLLALVLASGRELAAPDDALQMLRSKINELPGCGPATWRWLLKWGARPLWPFIRLHTHESRRAWQVTARFLSLWSRAGLPAPLPSPVSFEWAGRMPRSSELECCCPERVAVVAKHAACLSPAEAGRQAREMASVLEHAAKPLPLLDRNQKRAGWQWLRRESCDNGRTALVDGQVLARIRDRLPSVISVSGFDLVVLRDEQMIAEEGRRMDHCMDLAPSHYLNDGQLHFSVRDEESGQRVATCSLGIGQHRTVVTEVLGCSNQPAPRSARRAVEQLARHPELISAVRQAIT